MLGLAAPPLLCVVGVAALRGCVGGSSACIARCIVPCCAVLWAWSAENVSQCHSVVLVELVPVRGRAEPITIVPAECSTWLVPQVQEQGCSKCKCSKHGPRPLALALAQGHE